MYEDFGIFGGSEFSYFKVSHFCRILGYFGSPISHIHRQIDTDDTQEHLRREILYVLEHLSATPPTPFGQLHQQQYGQWCEYTVFAVKRCIAFLDPLKMQIGLLLFGTLFAFSFCGCNAVLLMYVQYLKGLKLEVEFLMYIDSLRNKSALLEPLPIHSEDLSLNFPEQ